jgi:UPF0755 protein
MARTLARLFGFGFILLLAAAAGAFLAWRHFEAPGPLERETVILVPKGSGVEAIARQLDEAGALKSPLIFSTVARLTGAGARLKAGEYALPPGISPAGIMDLLRRGQTVVHRLTVPEGSTARQVLALVQAAEALSGPLPAVPPEGSLLPETYHFSRGDSRAELIGRMSRAMSQLVDELWAGRDPAFPLKTKTELVTLASIVERETGIPEERPKVAGVFLNRLARGMRLQSDPTTIYGVSEGLGVLDRPLSRRDLDSEHMWNTYVIPGLPPSPIANPGRASLEAVLRPAKTDALYFVADGSGGHAFARTLEEHNQNVAKLRRLERQRQ